MRARTLLKVASLTFALTLAAAYGVTACTDGALDSCPGIVCNSCAGSGDCNIECSADEFSFCGHFGFFEDPNLRCAFCDSRSDPFASRIPTAP